MSDFGDANITVTIKGGKGFEAPWQVFKGWSVDQVKALIVEAFGFDDTTLDLTLNEVVANASQSAQNVKTLGDTLGAVAIRDGGLTNAPALDEAVANPSVLAAQQVTDTNPNAALIEALKNAATVEDLKTLWVRNKDAFKDADVKAAYSARGKALSGK